MKKVTINGYNIAIFKVENSLHVTVHPRHYSTEITSKEFDDCKEANLYMTNHFSEVFNDLPEDWVNRVVTNPHNNTKQVLIIIIK